MIIADTSIWIDFLRAKPSVMPAFEHHLERREILAAEGVFAELLQGARDTRERHVIQTYWNGLPRCQENGAWLEAGLRSGKERLFAKGVGIIDVNLLILSERMNARLWTHDKGLAALLPRHRLFVA